MIDTHHVHMSKALSQYSGQVVHLTHTDLDAVCSDAIVRRRHGEILTIYSSVQDFESHVDQLVASQARALNLYISDLGAHPNVVDARAKLTSKGWRVQWRDHHIWNEKTLKHAQQVVDYLRVDRLFCACEIVYQDLLPDDPIARDVAALGRDRDFWINDDPRSEMLSTVVYNDTWRRYVAVNLSKGVFSDENIEREYDKQMRKKTKSLKRALQRSYKMGHLAVTISTSYTSDVAAALRKRYNSTVEIVLRPTGIFSIRSVDPISNRIAELFCGGGHPNAAGGNLQFNFWDRILFRLRGIKLKKVQELLRTASTLEAKEA